MQDDLPSPLADTIEVSGDGVPSTLEARRRLLGRYDVGNVIGRGASGYVYRGRDTVEGRDVAIKFLRIEGDESSPRVGREIMALRALPIIGVVQYVDDFPLGNDHVIVTELVDGQPFPGHFAPEGGLCAWDQIREMVMALLEILERVHEIGVIHRDLKPQNVLVRRDGRPVILDFGLARGAVIGETFTQTGARLGTPRYWSPEQMLSQPTDRRTDVYSLGVMLFEALTGKLPPAQQAADLHRVMAAKPVSLADHLPDAPWRLVRVVDRMLELRAEERFSTASEVLQALRGEDGHEWATTSLPRLGSTEEVLRLAAAIRAGRSEVVRGASGLGRTRLIKDALALAAEGRRVLWLPPSNTPFASLAPLIGPLENAPLSSVSEAVERQVAAALAEGTIVVADPVEGLDGWSRAVIERARDGGCVVQSTSARGEDGVALSPLGAEDLEALFHGPERLLHLPSDAAAALHRRTDGIASRVDQEISAWVRAGLCEWEGDRLRIDRAAIETLAGGVTLAPAMSWGGGSRPKLTADQEDLLCWVHLASPNANESLLPQLTGLPTWHVEALVEDLARMGALRREGGKLELLFPALRLAAWSGERLQQAHRAIAEMLPADRPERVRHLLLAGDVDALQRDTIAAATALVAEGKLGLAESLFAPALAVVRGRRRADVESKLLTEQALVALQMRSPAAIRRVAHELSRAANGAELETVRCLVTAELEGMTGNRQVTREELRALGPLKDPRLELRRRVSLLQAERIASMEEESRTLRDFERDALTSPDPEIRRRLAGWKGLHLYRLGDFAGAAQQHLEAVGLAVTPSARMLAQLNAASALLEDNQLERALEIATQAGETARAIRHTRAEARSEWIRRAVVYRSSSYEHPDLELAEAVRHIGDPYSAANVLLIEAAVAWRLGDPHLARSLAREAAASFAEGELRAGEVLARSLAIACGAPVEGGRLEALAQELIGVEPPEVAAQAFALLSPVLESHGAPVLKACETRWLEALDSLSAARCLDILAVGELRAALREAHDIIEKSRGAGVE